MIAIQNLDPARYQKIMDMYEVGSLGRSSKELDNIEAELNIIDQFMGVTNNVSPQYVIAAISVSDNRCQPLTLPLRGQLELSFSLSHKLFWQRMYTIS